MSRYQIFADAVVFHNDYDGMRIEETPLNLEKNEFS